MDLRIKTARGTLNLSDIYRDISNGGSYDGTVSCDYRIHAEQNGDQFYWAVYDDDGILVKDDGLVDSPSDAANAIANAIGSICGSGVDVVASRDAHRNRRR